MVDSTTTISFSTPDADINPTLALDSKYHEEIYADEGKSRFKAGVEPAYLKAIPANSQYPYSLHTSAGEFTVVSPGIPFEIEETLIFSMTDEATLTHEPLSPGTAEWIGNNAGMTVMNGRSVTVETPVVGVLKCTYTTLGDRLQLTAPESDDEEESYQVALVTLYADDKKGAATVTIDTEYYPPIDVTLVARDVCSGDVIPGATVTVEGKGSKVANAYGKVIFENMTQGGVYNVKTVAPGFISSDADALSNDQFTVPIVETSV